MLRAIWKAAKSALSNLLGFASAASAAAGVAQQAGVPMVIPAWAWWLIAIACLAALVIHLQWQLDQAQAPSIRRLERQQHVTFREIAEALSQTEAYSRDEIIDRLRIAALSGEFASRFGRNRLMITDFDKDQVARRRVSFDYGKREDLNDPGAVLYEGALLYDALTDQTGGADGRITLRQRDFARWYRRFQEGRYEQ